MATRTKSGSKPDGATWAAGRTYRKRVCETCRWGARHPEGLRFINDALEARRKGATFSWPDLEAEVRARFGYQMTGDAIRMHYTREFGS